MPAWRRGFKAEAGRIADELRAELGLRAADKLDPHILAQHLLVPIIDIVELSDEAPSAVRHLVGPGRGEFSAVTIFVGQFRRCIVTNSAHRATRQMNSMCHELSHIILDHEPESPGETGGRRDWNGQQEREADWLAGCLLIPQAATHAAAIRSDTDAEVSAAFGVSEKLATWRMNATGARIRARRLARYRRPQLTRGAG